MRRPGLLPLASRYILREFGSAMAICLVAFVTLYLAVDFFERLPTFLSHQASSGLMVSYFLFKTPLIVAQVAPIAVLAATLQSLGTLARRNEIMAFRSSGISLLQIGAPLILAALAISCGSILWSEYVVPECAARARFIERVRIKKRAFKGLFSEAEIWYHGLGSFTNIRRFDARRGEIYGYARFEVDREFGLRRIVEAPSVRWEAERWIATGATERWFGRTGEIHARRIEDGAIAIEETPEDLTAVHHDPDELSFQSLLQEVRDLSRKGIDTTEMRVDLWLKTAVPFVSLIMVLLAVPLATRPSRQASVAASVGLTLVVGFSYWVVLAISASLGYGGAVAPPLAAWLANGVFLSAGAWLFLSAE